MRGLIVATALMLSFPVRANVTIAPTFADFAVAGRFILLVSPDQKRLVCVDDSGFVRWRRPVATHGGFGVLDEQAFYVQDGSRVLRVDAATGSSSLIGSIPRGEVIAIDTRERFVSSAPADPSERRFVVRDPRTLKRLWSDGRIESVAGADDRRVFAVTVIRHPEKDGGYTMSDGKLVALDRTTGRELWSHPLNGPQTGQARAAVVGPYLAVIEGIMPSTLVLLDRASGRVVASRASTESRADGLFDIQPDGSSELLVLETMRNNDPDRLTRLSVPELKPLSSVPLRAKENLFFFIDGSTVVTSGIYSVAAFDRSTGERRWEIDEQRLIQRPTGGRIFATLNDDDSAVVERIDVTTGAESRIYEEPLPANLTAAALEREAQEWRRRAEKTKQEHYRDEEKQQLHAGDEICLRFDQSGLLSVREYWRLHRDGVAEYVDVDPQLQSFRAFGHWRKSGDTYEIDGTPLVRDIAADDVYVGVGIKPNLELLPELRDALEAYLFAHAAQQTFSRDDLRILDVRRPGCPPEALSWCAGDSRHLAVSQHFSYPDQAVRRESLDALLHAMDAYLHDSANTDHLRFRLHGYRSYVYAEWLDPHSFWSDHSRENAEREIDTAIDMSRFAGANDAAAPREPSLFRLCRCDELARELARVPNVITAGAK